MKNTIWVTGGSKGIGKAIADKFEAEDWNVAISSRSISNFDTVKNPLLLRCDVSDENNVKATFDEIISKFETLDVLVNNAGIGIFKKITDTSVEDFRQQIETNLVGTFLCSKAVIPMMIEKKKGLIINIISVAALKAFANSGAYGATKAGALMLSKVMREELKEHNIKVVSVIPGATATEIWNPKVLEKYSERMIKPEEIAEVVYNVAMQPKGLITEEIVLRPILGDL